MISSTVSEYLERNDRDSAAGWSEHRVAAADGDADRSRLRSAAPSQGRKERMALPNEHDDDLEPEVIEGAEIEQETFEDEEEGSGPTTEQEQEPDDESSDTI
jgi:hypothetical protein